MGREIRRVPADWEHPRFTKEDVRDRREIGEFKPLYDQCYEDAAEEWLASFDLWRKGEHPHQHGAYAAGCRYYWEYDPTPDEDYYRSRKWTPEEATHFQVYQTVSEGSPVTPVFASLELLADYLVQYGDFWDQIDERGGWSREAADRFVKAGHAFTLVAVTTPDGTQVFSPRDGQPIDPS